jgi:broad specificity phosphatase PhoE
MGKCTQLQVLVVIRHGESEFNAALQKGDGWIDPKLYDPSLTAKGCQQARHLRQKLLHEMQKSSSLIGQNVNALWVTSPLRRCIQTFLLSCPLLPKTASDHDNNLSTTKAVCQQVQEKLAAVNGHTLPPVRIVR